MKIFKFIFILTVIGLANCRPGNQTDTLIINLNDARKNKVEVKFSEVVKRVEYIQPETTDESIVFWSSNCVISDQYMFLVVGQTSASILCFRRNGEFVGQIGRNGKGPNEYISPYELELSPDQKHLFWLDTRQKRVFRYSLKESTLKQVYLKGSIYLHDLAVTADHIYISTLPDISQDNPCRIIELDYDLNRTGGYLPVDHIPERFFPAPNHLYFYKDHFYLNTLESNEILIYDKKFRLNRKISFSHLIDRQELNNIKFWGDEIIAEFRETSEFKPGETSRYDLGWKAPQYIIALFDLDGNCRSAEFIDDITGFHKEQRLGEQTQSGYLNNHMPIENVQRWILEKDPRGDHYVPELKKLVLASKPDDNPIILIYWTR